MNGHHGGRRGAAEAYIALGHVIPLSGLDDQQRYRSNRQTRIRMNLEYSLFGFKT